MKTTLFCLLSLFSLAAAALTGTSQLSASTNTPLQLSGSGTLSVFDTALLTAFGLASTATSVGVTLSSSVAATVTVSIGADTNFNAGLFASASGTSAPQVGLLSTLSSSGALSVIVTSNAATQLTITLTIPAVSAFLGSSTSAGLGLHLIAPSTEFSATGTTGSTFYGAVAYNFVPASNTYTYTIPINTAGTAQNLYLTGLDLLQATSASTSASVGASAAANANGGSAVFSANANANAGVRFFPVAYNTAFPVIAGVQYNFGKNIQVAPLVNGSTLSIALNSNFAASGASAAPSTSNGGYFNGNYQFSGSQGASNVIQWSSDSSSTFTSSSGQAVTAAQVSGNAQFANAASWYRSTASAGASTTANTWTQVQSQRSNVNGKVSVWASVQSYSQWTVASSTSTNSTGTGNPGSASNVQISVAAVFAALALVFAF